MSLAGEGSQTIKMCEFSCFPGNQDIKASHVSSSWSLSVTIFQQPESVG